MEGNSLNNPDDLPSVSDTWITRWVAKPVSYLFLTDLAEDWLASIQRQRAKLIIESYPHWYECMMEILWTVDLMFKSIAQRIGMMFKG